MRRLPLEIISLIVSEIWSPYDDDCLSAIALAVPATIPFVREHRFKVLDVSSPYQMDSILAIVQGAEEVWQTIRQLTLECFAHHFSKLSCLVSGAVNVKTLVLRGNFKYNQREEDWLLEMQDFMGACTRITALHLINFTFPRLSDLFHILHSIPHLTTLGMRWVDVRELRDMAYSLWPNYRLSPSCPRWDPRDFEAPKPLLGVSHLKLELQGASTLLQLDLISSPKSPFPNLQEMVFDDSRLYKYSPRRLPALLDKYCSSLRVLDVTIVIDYLFPALVLPATMEHFKFYLVGDDELRRSSRICQILSSGSASLKIVTVRMYELPYPPNLEELDKVLACMDLDKWVLEVHVRLRDCVEQVMENFKLCLKRCVEGEWGGGIIWVVDLLKDCDPTRTGRNGSIWLI